MGYIGGRQLLGKDGNDLSSQTFITKHLVSDFSVLKKFAEKSEEIIGEGVLDTEVRAIAHFQCINEIAKSLSKKGFDTTLISGPTNLEINDDIK